MHSTKPSLLNPSIAPDDDQSSGLAVLHYGLPITGIIPMIIGGVWLGLWTCGLPQQWALTPAITMKANAALSLFLAGTALLALGPGTTSSRRRWAGFAAAVVVLLSGSLTLSEHLFRCNLGIDQLLFTEPTGAAAVTSPNRMGPPASLSFTLIGMALLALAFRRRAVAPYLGVIVYVIALIPAVGYVYGALSFYGKASLTGIAWSTVLGLILLGVGLVLSRTDGGPTALLLRQDAGGRLVRQLLPATLFVPLVLGYVRGLGERAGLYGDITGRALLVVALTLLFSAGLWLSASRLSSSALEETKAQQKLRQEREALRENEAQFRNLANAIPQLCWMANADGWIFWYNDRWYEYTGTTPKQMEGWGWQSVHDPEMLPKVLERWKVSIASGQPFDMVFPLRGADGVFRPFLTRVMPVQDADGKIVRWFGTNTDFSDQQRNEQALRESEGRFRSLFEYAPVGIKQVALDGRLLTANPALCHMLGYSESELLGKTFEELTHQDDRERERQQIDAMLRGRREFVHIDLRYLHRDGSPVWVTLATSSVKDSAGEPLYRISIVQDIRARKQAEEALRESLERLEKVLEVETVGVMFWDLNTGYMVDANDTFLKLMGYDRSDVDERKLSWQKLTPPEYMDVSRAEVEKFLATGRVGPYEKEYFRKDGTRQWLLFAGSSLGNSQCVEFCVDIADRKKTEQELVELNQQLEDRVRRRTAELETMNREAAAFSYSVSHDLRGPLRTLDGFSQALLEDHAEHLNEKGRHYLERIRMAAQRMGSLIDALLQLSRLTRAPMEMKPVDLSGLAASVIEDLQRSEPNRKVDVSIEPGLQTRGDAGLLQVAIQNLLANAWKFTSRREHARIEFGRVNGRSNATFFIRDNGAGFDMQYGDQLFGPFQRLHSEADFTGTGIGLATVQRVILRHHGRIWAEAAEGQGATFYFELGV